MATTLPELTEAIDDEFLSTWYEIRTEAVDNILDANVVSAALREAGCFKAQVGERIITRTVRYGKKTAVGLGRGDVLPADETPLETMAWWPWKYFVVEVTRSLIDDQQNNGPQKIKDYATGRLSAARDALVEKTEDIIMADDIHPDIAGSAGTTLTDAKLPFSLHDIAPYLASTNFQTSGYNYGNIRRDNAWWQHIDFTAAVSSGTNRKGVKAGPSAITMYDDLVNIHNTIGANKEPPNLYILTQTMYEIFESFVNAKDQLIKEADTRLADLGYDVLRFKGKRLIWTAALATVAGSAATLQALVLNTDYIDLVYDPNLWFDMSEWRTPARQMDRVAYLTSSLQIVCSQLRRQGRVLWSA